MTLRRVQASGFAALSQWLTPIAHASGFERFAGAPSLTTASTQLDLFLYSDHAGEAFVAIKRHAPIYQAAQIDFVAVTPARRRLGIGGRAALAAEKRFSSSVRSLYVTVPSATGIALYFWLRLGYRPLMQSCWPRLLDEASTWMVRDLG